MQAEAVVDEGLGSRREAEAECAQEHAHLTPQTGSRWCWLEGTGAQASEVGADRSTASEETSTERLFAPAAGIRRWVVPQVEEGESGGCRHGVGAAEVAQAAAELHAAVRVAGGDRERLERLCRYAGRPAIAENRLSQLPDGRVAYRLKRRWQDGTTHVVLEPQVLLERLCALVPRPRRHLVTYHGVFAPAAGIRRWVVPQVEEGESGGCRHGVGAAEVAQAAAEPAAAIALLARRNVPHVPGQRRRGRRRYSWAELLRHVFLIDVLVCRHCSGRRRVLAAIHDPEAIRRVLESLGLPPEPPVVAPARGPPEPLLPWE